MKIAARHFEPTEQRPGKLAISTIDEKTFVPRSLELQKKEGAWVLPLKSDYPADAAKQVGEATYALQTLERLDLATIDPAAHTLYGVIDPEKAQPGETGVGALVLALLARRRR